MAKSVKRALYLVACSLGTGLGTGFSPIAPGTAGTLVGVLVAILLGGSGFTWVMAIALAVCVAAGIWSSHYLVTTWNKDDDQRIVIDEVAGYLVTVSFADRTDWRYLLAAFVLFRLFDITKPQPARWADVKVHGGFGVMLDDLIAGVYGALGIFAMQWILSR